MKTIDKLITLLDFGAQIGADVTISKEDVPILLEALYWQRFYERFKPFNFKKG